MGDNIFETILIVLLVYALLCGVTINGKHYGVYGCNDKSGVIIDK